MARKVECEINHVYEQTGTFEVLCVVMSLTEMSSDKNATRTRSKVNDRERAAGRRGSPELYQHPDYRYRVDNQGD